MAERLDACAGRQRQQQRHRQAHNNVIIYLLSFDFKNPTFCHVLRDICTVACSHRMCPVVECRNSLWGHCAPCKNDRYY